LLKRWFVVNALIFAIALSFAAQICVFSVTSKKGFSGVVYGANGPIVGALVSASGENGSGYAVTDNNGNYNISEGLKTGTYNVSVSLATGYVDNETSGISVVAGQTTKNVNFDLQLSGGISGTVTDAVSGNPLNDTLVTSTYTSGTGTYGYSATTDSNGKYTMITDMPTGTYNVTVESPVGHISNSTTTTVTSGVLTKNVNIPLEPSGIISGRITAPDGTPVNATVSAVSTSPFYYGTAKTDANGNYSIVSGLGTASDYIVSATANVGSGYNSTMMFMTPEIVSVTAGQETGGVDLELTVTPPKPSGTIAGQVTDQSSHAGIPYADVTASGSNGYGFNFTDSNGYYTISGLGAGSDYNVSATASGYEDYYYPTLVTVVVNQTTSGVNLQMTKIPPTEYGSISGTVTGVSNPIITELQYPLFVALSLTVVAATAGKMILKKKRPQDTLRRTLLRPETMR
jgi:hypothetical protein